MRNRSRAAGRRRARGGARRARGDRRAGARRATRGRSAARRRRTRTACSGRVVRAAHGRFDLGAMRSIAVLCGVLVLCAAPFLFARYRPRLAIAVTRRRLRRPRAAGDRAPGRPARRDGAVGQRQRRDVPDRDRRRPRPARPRPVRPRLRRLRARALLRRRPSAATRRASRSSTSPTSPACRRSPPRGGSCPGRSTTCACSSR